jgi:lipoprotein NlpD
MRSTSSIRIAIVCTMLGLLAACSTPKQRAPVEDRGATRNPSVGAAAAGPAALPPTAEPAKPPPGAENAGKPGYFTVKPGDTMIRIGLETGQNWRDIARWNGIDNPNTLEVGQVLRVLPPGVDPNAPATKAVTASRVEPRPLDAKPSPAAASGAASAAAPVIAAAPAVAAAPAASATTPPAAREPDDDIAWGWPSGSAVAVPFDETRTKGLVFAGKAGDPVFAAADGRVVYAGSGLRGYGNLVIVKHNGTYLSAYAHNQALLVKEDQVVRRGQRIAEMGSSDAERVQLHFEIRRLGKPVDPARLLPAR